MKDFTFWSNDEEADEIYAADVVEKLLEMKKNILRILQRRLVNGLPTIETCPLDQYQRQN